jgi:NTE family protein
LFEAPYTRALIELGASDTFARRGDVERFFNWGGSAPAST